MRPKYRDEFEIAIICALPREADAVEALFDETYDNLSQEYGKQPGDANAYTNGKIGQHNIVLCYMSGMGKVSAASAASSLRVSYPSIQIALLVGICGGIPSLSDGTPVSLGDVILSDRVIEYDFGRQYPDGFERKSDVKETSGRHSRETKSILAGLKTRSIRKEFQDRVSKHLQTLQSETVWQLPCDTHCPHSPSVHIGTIACADTVMKSAEHRDTLTTKEDIIGFEMEGAGVWDNIPCIIIKGVCDYADDQKNKIWQDYAAATRASTAKAFLEYWIPAARKVITEADKQCLVDLLLTDPRDERVRIEKTKGGVLQESSSWILQNSVYQQWRSEKENQLLWLKGDAGKGKTMLMISMIDEISQQIDTLSDGGILLSFFICQGIDSRLNTATAILRGLIYLLATQKPSLVLHLRQKYDQAGHKLFDNPNSFYTLAGIFQSMLHDPNLPVCYFVVDAIDECSTDLPAFLDLIADTTAIQPSKIKWAVSSRNRDDIEQRLQLCNSHQRLSLELNADQISRAIDIFISHKVGQLVSLQHSNELHGRVVESIREKADGTFLWVALIFKEFQGQVLASDILQVVQEVPAGLTPLYDEMMKRMQQFHQRNVQRCLSVLSTAALAYRPLHILEMHTLAGFEKEGVRKEELERVINMCSSFLTVRDEFIYFIHQSAKDYLVVNKSGTIFPLGTGPVNYNIFLTSLDAMSIKLRQDIYDLSDPGIMEKSQKRALDPLTHIRYSCVFWFDHFCDVGNHTHEYVEELSDDGKILRFLLTHLPHWLESLGLIHEVSVGITIIRKIQRIVQSRPSPQLRGFLKDASRVMLSYGPIIEKSPLQIYGAGLTFSPTNSEVKKLHWSNRLPCIKSITGLQGNWDACLQTLEGHKENVGAVEFSPDGQMLASASRDCSIRLWDATTGFLMHILEAHTAKVNDLSFSSDANLLASGSDDGTVWVWNTVVRRQKQLVQSDEGAITAIVFSPNAHVFAYALSSGTVQLCDADTGAITQIFHGQKNMWEAFQASAEVQAVFQRSQNITQAVCDPEELSNAAWVRAMTTSPDGKTIALPSENGSVQLWNPEAESWTQVVQNQKSLYQALAFSPDLQASIQRAHRITGDVLGGYRHRNENCVEALRFSPDGRALAMASKKGTIQMWDKATNVWKEIHRVDKRVTAIVFSPDCQTIAIGFDDHKVRLWDLDAMAMKRDITEIGTVADLSFTPDGRSLLSASLNSLKYWNGHTGTFQSSLKTSTYLLTRIAFSPNGQILATGTTKGPVLLWDTCVKEQVQSHYRFKVSAHLDGLNFSPAPERASAAPLRAAANNAQKSALGMFQGLFRIFSLTPRKHGQEMRGDHPPEPQGTSWRQELEGHFLHIEDIAISPDGEKLASASADSTVQLWNVSSSSWEETLAGHDSGLTRVQFSPDGRTLLSTEIDDTVKLWDTATGECKLTVQSSEPHIYSEFAFSPDGSTIALVFSDNTIRLWDTDRKVRSQILKGHKDVIDGLAFSPNGQLLASASDEDDCTIRLWGRSHTAHKFTLRFIFNPGQSQRVVSFSWDSTLLASGSSDGTVQVWDLDAWTCKWSLHCNDCFVNSVAFSLDGRILASAYSDRTIRLWDLRKGDLKEEITLGRSVECISFSSDDRYLLTNRGVVSLYTEVSGTVDNQEQGKHVLFVEDEWITHNRQKLLWLPPDYRPTSCVVYGSTVVLGLATGQMVFINFDLD